MKYRILILLFSFGFSCTESQEPQQDQDQIPQNGIQIGDQIWMRENLKVKTFRNGDPIEESKTTEDWIRLYNEGKPAWTSYLWEENNEIRFGLIYNYYALTDPRGIAPQNWRIPTSNDFFQLIEYNGGGNDGAEKIMSSEFWEENPGTNESGFDARPGGEIWIGGSFGGLGNSIGYWTNSQAINGNPISVFISSIRPQKFVFNDENSIERILDNKGGSYIRCIKE